MPAVPSLPKTFKTPLQEVVLRRMTLAALKPRDVADEMLPLDTVKAALAGKLPLLDGGTAALLAAKLKLPDEALKDPESFLAREVVEKAHGVFIALPDDSSDTVAAPEPEAAPAENPADGTAIADTVDAAPAEDTPAAAPEPAISLGRMNGLLKVRFADLTLGDNPRKAIDARALEALAESIADQGVLQNLVVADWRLHDDAPPRWLVLAGQRRYRAIERLIAQARWNADEENVPVGIFHGGEQAYVALQLLENMHREPLPLLDECAALAALHASDPETWTHRAIGQSLKRSENWVGQRVRIHNDLHDKARELVQQGVLDFKRARLLTALPKKQQAVILNNCRSDNHAWAAQELTRLIEGHTEHSWPEQSLAAFPLYLYNGGREIDEDTGTTWLTDVDQFLKLQRATANARIASMIGQRKSADLLDVLAAKGARAFNTYDWPAAPKSAADTDTHFIIELRRDGALIEHDRLLKRDEMERAQKAAEKAKAKERAAKDRSAGKAAAADEPAEAPPFTQAFSELARAHKTHALQDAILREARDGNLEPILNIVCLALLRQASVSNIGGGYNYSERLRPQSAELRKVIMAAIEGIGTKKTDRPAVDAAARLQPHQAVDGDRARNYIFELTPKKRLELFAALVADTCEVRPDNGGPGLDEATLDAADIAGVTMADWRPDETWLDKARKPRLLALAKDLGLWGDVQGMKTAELKAYIHSHTWKWKPEKGAEDPTPPWLPPEMMFCSAAELDQLMRKQAARKD